MRIIYEEILEIINSNNKFSILLYNITALIFIILFYVYINLADISSFKTVAFLDELINDLKKSPILDFSLNDNFYSPNGYYNIKLGKWEGSKIGCKCEKDIDEGECSEEKKLIRCETLYPYPPEGYYYFRKNIFSAKRFDINYKDLIKDNLIFQKGSNCPKEMKKCGIIDSLDNILCMNQSGDCPINDIIIDNKEKIENYTDIKLNDNYFFHYTNKMVNKKIISDLFIFKGKPCYDSQEYNWEKYYPLEYESKCKTNKKKYDERYGEPLDSYNQSLFYFENYISPYIFYFYNKDLIDKTKLINAKVDLFYRNFIGYDLECLKDKKINDLLFELKELRDIVEVERFFYSRIYYYFNYIIKWLGKLPLFWNELYIIAAALIWNWLIQLNKTVEIIFKLFIPEIIIIIIILYEFFSMKKPNRSAFDIIDKIFDCCDEYTQSKLKKLSKQNFNIIFFREMNLIFLIAGILIILIILFFTSILIILIKDIIAKRFKECKKDHKLLNEEVQDKELIDLNLH